MELWLELPQQIMHLVYLKDGMTRPKRAWRPNKKRVPWKAIRKHNRKRPASSLEKTVYKWLEEDEIPFTREKSIGKHMHVDIFLEPKTCIELNGCHWHGCAICNKVLTKEHKIAQNKDAKRYFRIRRLGFDVVIFWEHEIHSNSDRVKAMLKALAKNK